MRVIQNRQAQMQEILRGRSQGKGTGTQELRIDSELGLALEGAPKPCLSAALCVLLLPVVTEGAGQLCVEHLVNGGNGTLWFCPFL